MQLIFNVLTECGKGHAGQVITVWQVIFGGIIFHEKSKEETPKVIFVVLIS